MGLTALREAIETLAGSEDADFADGESIEELHRQLARLEAVVTVKTAAFDASAAWTADGARNSAAWVATRCRLPKGHARRRVHLGRRLRYLPVAAGAWLAGEINQAHVSALAGARRAATEQALARDEEMLVGYAKDLRFESFARALAYWEQLADPDGTEADDEARRTRRGVWLDVGFDRMWAGKIHLDPVSGAIVAGELERIEAELFAADWAEAKARLGGQDPMVGDLPRTPAQRRADALVEMATRSGTAPADGRRPAPLFSVFVGYETFRGRICELAQGVVLTPGALIPWLDEAMIERAVFAPGGRVEVSATSRLFTGATRRAIELRDRGCAHPYCDQPLGRCQADHVIPWAAGGATTQENGRLLCGFHNRLRHQRPPPGTWP